MCTSMKKNNQYVHLRGESLATFRCYKNICAKNDKTILQQFSGQVKYVIMALGHVNTRMVNYFQTHFP